jgi:hypothetical protein
MSGRNYLDLLDVLFDFPPTQRFGLVVLAGCIIDILANLFVLPLLGGAQLKNDN